MGGLQSRVWVTIGRALARYTYPNNDLIEFIEITRLVSFDIKFTRQGFENAC